MISFTIAHSLVSALTLAISHPSWLANRFAREESCDSATIASLPLVQRPATSDTGQVLVLLLTGDGGWASADEGVSRALLSHGAAVIGLNMRSWLSRPRSPDEFAGVVTCVAESYMARWRRPWLMLLGYSRGADLAPFAASRLAPELRRRLTTLALVSPGQWAGFTFHLIDLVRDVHRPDDLPVSPELAKLRELSVLCISGRQDSGALCPALTGDNVQVVMLDGGHRISGGYKAMAEWLEKGLRPPASRPP